MTKDTTPPWRVKFPEEDKLTRHLKTSLVAACYGNERIADVLDQLMCAASWEAKNKGYPEKEKVVRIKRTAQEILDMLQFPTSRRTLNTYLHQLNEWGYVLSQPYQRDFDVHFETIQVAIDNPPAQPEKSCSEGLQEKGGKCADLPPSEREEKGGKVAMLSTKVANLHKKVETLSTNVASLATFQTRLEALEKLVQDHFFGATDITGNTTNITGNNVVASHNALTFTLLTEEDFQDIEKKMAKVLHQGNMQNDTPLTPAGNNLPTQEPGFPQSSTLPENTEPPFLDNASSEPPNRQKTGSEETQPINTQPAQDTPSESQRRGQESTSSTQAVNGTSNQATEQGEQASGVSDSQSTTQKTQRGRGKNTGKEEKPASPKKAKPVVPAEEMTLRKEVHIWINQRRGYSLQNRATTKQIIDENTACITLGHMLYVTQYEQNIEEGCTWDDLSFVWDFSVKNDKYWSQPNNKSRFGAHALLQMFAQTIVKRKPNNVTPMRPTNNPPEKQEPTPEKAASIAAAEAVMARLKQRQAI